MPERQMKGSFCIRFFAAAIDVGLGLIFALSVSNSIGMLFAHRAVVMLKIGSPNTLWQGAIPLVLGILGTFVYAIPFAMLVALVPEALCGATAGKILLGLRVRGRYRASKAAWRLWLRSLVKTSGLWLMTTALLLGRWELAVLSLIFMAAVLLGSLLILGSCSLALHDRLSGTEVLHPNLSKNGLLFWRANSPRFQGRMAARF